MSLPVLTTSVCRGGKSNTQPSACETIDPIDCATAAIQFVRSDSRPSVRLLTFYIFIFFCWTTGPISTKIGTKQPWLHGVAFFFFQIKVKLFSMGRLSFLFISLAWKLLPFLIGKNTRNNSGIFKMAGYLDSNWQAKHSIQVKIDTPDWHKYFQNVIIACLFNFVRCSAYDNIFHFAKKRVLGWEFIVKPVLQDIRSVILTTEHSI